MASHFGEPSILPLELCIMIINHLHGDLVTLASCALVCRAWLRSSHRHLSYQREIYERHAADLAELLTSPACTITSNLTVCHLRIDGKDCKLPEDFLALNVALRNVRDRSTSIQLRQLSLDNLHWSSLSHNAIADLLSFRMIRELYVEKSHFRSVKSFADLLLAFPYLRRLEIGWSYAIGGNSLVSARDIIRERPVMPNLQVLKIVGDLVQPSLHYLSPPKTRGIRDISVRSLRSSDIPGTCQFVKGLGPDLENLELGLRCQEPLEELVALARYSKLGTFDTLPGLRSFRIELTPRTLCFQVSRTPSSWFLTCISVCLKHLNAPTLEHLQFLFQVGEGSLELPSRNFASIADAMANPRFSCLKTLLFEVGGDGDERSRVIKFIRLHLTEYEERGILKVAEFR